MMHIRWARLTGHCGRKAGKNTVRPRFLLFFDVSFFGKQKDNFLFGFFYWFFILVGPGILGLALGFSLLVNWSLEFANVGGWLTSGNFALDSCAQFLAVAEHRLILSRARSICQQLRRAGYHSLWAPSCQNRGCWWSCWSFVKDFFRFGRVLRTTLPIAQGEVVHFLFFW